MELEIQAQAISLAAALLCGVAQGLVYEIFRLMRRIWGASFQLLFDALFCLSVFVMAFVFGQTVCKGRLGLWETAGLAVGFMAYMRFAAPVFGKRKKQFKKSGDN